MKRIAVYSNSVAMAEMFQDGDKFKLILTTPVGTTYEDIDSENEAERLWMVMHEIVDAWDEYGKEVD